MAYYIQLTRYEVQNVQWLSYGAYRMRVEVTAAEGDGLDPYLFIYQRFPQSPYLPEPCDHFVAIAGPAQLADVPIGEPNQQQYWPFFRLSYFECDFTSKELAEEVWRIVQAEARALCDALTRYEQLSLAEEVWIPREPPDESGDSESGSESESQSQSESESQS